MSLKIHTRDTCAHVCTHMQTHVHMHTHKHTRTHTLSLSLSHTHTHTHTHPHTHAHAHTHAHTHTHTHTHTQTRTKNTHTHAHTHTKLTNFIVHAVSNPNICSLVQKKTPPPEVSEVHHACAAQARKPHYHATTAADTSSSRLDTAWRGGLGGGVRGRMSHGDGGVGSRLYPFVRMRPNSSILGRSVNMPLKGVLGSAARSARPASAASDCVRTIRPTSSLS